ncbi:hypothetical protein ACLBOM_31860 [Escherichia coli]
MFKGYFDLSVKDTLKTWAQLQWSTPWLGLLLC